MSENLAEQMRQGMRRLASGVSVVTTVDENGTRLAMTASSVTSLSDSPPSLLVCIHKESYLSEAIQNTNKFSVNVLAAHQQDISVQCSLPDANVDRFALGHWMQHEVNGLYYLADALSVFHCKRESMMEYGTHYIFIGDIESVTVQGENVAPLVYLNGRYVQLEDSQ